MIVANLNYGLNYDDMAEVFRAAIKHKQAVATPDLIGEVVNGQVRSRRDTRFDEPAPPKYPLGISRHFKNQVINLAHTEMANLRQSDGFKGLFDYAREQGVHTHIFGSWAAWTSNIGRDYAAFWNTTPVSSRPGHNAAYPY